MSEHDITDSKDAMLISLRLLFKNNKFKCKIALLQTKKFQNEMIKVPSDYQHQVWDFSSDPLALGVFYGVLEIIRAWYC